MAVAGETGVLVAGGESLADVRQRKSDKTSAYFARMVRRSKMNFAGRELVAWRDKAVAVADAEAVKSGADSAGWLVCDLVAGLGLLLAQAGLDGRPAATDVTVTAAGWLQVLLSPRGGRRYYWPGYGELRRRWVREADEGALPAAVRCYLADDERGKWPSVGQILVRVPTSTWHPCQPPLLSAPELSAAEKAAAAEFAGFVRGRLREGATVGEALGAWNRRGA